MCKSSQDLDLNKLERLGRREAVHLTLFPVLQKPSMLGPCQPSQETLDRKSSRPALFAFLVFYLQLDTNISCQHLHRRRTVSCLSQSFPRKREKLLRKEFFNSVAYKLKMCWGMAGETHFFDAISLYLRNAVRSQPKYLQAFTIASFSSAFKIPSGSARER